MDNDLFSQEPPAEFSSVAVAVTSFVKIPSPLDGIVSLASSNTLIRCQILITKYSQLLEIENGVVIRVEKLPFNDISKVVIYHEFNPLRRYIICLTKCQTAYLLSYENLEVIRCWENVHDISIDDPHNTGRPQLQLCNSTGNCLPVDGMDFLIGKQSTDQSRGKVEAAAALANKLKASLWHCQSLQAESQRKELYVTRKLSDIARQLKSCKFGMHNNTVPEQSTSHFIVDENQSRDHTRYLSSQSAVEGQTSSVSGEAPGMQILKILSTRQRIIHEKWIICVNIANDSDSFLIREPHLTLCCSRTQKRLAYSTKFLKTVQRKPRAAEQDESQWDIAVEEVDPPILRPGKRAFLIAICSLPDFTSSSEATCNGLISFRVRSLRPSDLEERNVLMQTPINSVLLSILDMKNVCVNMLRQSSASGFSLDLLALIAASAKHTVMVSTMATPLDQVISKFDNEEDIVKVSFLNCFHYFNSSVSDPLYYAAFACKLTSANTMMLTMYSKDDNQGILVLRWLQGMMPKDVLIKTDMASQGSEGCVQENLISKMYDCIAVITKKAQQNLDNEVSKKVKFTKEKFSADAYEEERKYLESRRTDMVWSAEDYLQWRETLHDTQLRMEQLFSKYSE